MRYGPSDARMAVFWGCGVWMVGRGLAMKEMGRATVGMKKEPPAP